MQGTPKYGIIEQNVYYIMIFEERSQLMKHKSKKKPVVIVLVCLAVLAAAAACVWFLWLKDYLAASSAPPVYVNSVASITGMDMGTNPRYAGVVEPQQTYDVTKDESKTVAEVLVAEGDQVQPGTPLFRYDTEEMQLTLEQAELDLEGISNQISTLKNQLSDLEKEKKKASKDEQYSYTVQIQSVELQIKNEEYNSTVKKSEIDKLKSSLENAEVYSEVEGVVKEVNVNGGTDITGQPLPFISILSSGEYRVKGTISELNLGSLYQGQAVIVHSRVDESQTWTGLVDTIEMEPTDDRNNNMYYMSGDTGQRSSRYNFYVTLDSLEGLILGQHVYIEPDLGPAAQREGLWLPAAYIDHDEVGSFVWAADENDRLEIRSLTLGDYDAENDMYQITSGLTAQDRIAYPSEELVEGGPVTSDESLAAGPVQDPAFPEDGTAVDDGMLYGEEGMDGSAYLEDGTYDDTYGNTDTDTYDDTYDDTEAGDAELDGGVTVEARDAGAAFDLVQDSEGAA